MCGIDGLVVARGRPVRADLVERMNEGLRHRGPDEGAMETFGFGVVGNRRLSIIDVENGRQPMRSQDGRYVLVYNGELYDYRLLRSELQNDGYVFRTHSDTEVLLNAYHRWQIDSLERFNGMYAFAIVDLHEQSLVIARDPIGIKPLYYHRTSSGDFIFSSELKSLLVHPSVPRELDRESLAGLMVDRFVAGPWTLLRGVYELPPGHWLEWKDGEITVRRYYRPSYEQVHRSEAEALEHVKTVLDSAVRSQLVADVPVGVFLSGGIDSSTVAALAIQATGTLKTFSVRMQDPARDESAAARLVARHLGTDHHEIDLPAGGFDMHTMDLLVDHLGQPLVDTSCIPTYLVSLAARGEVKVALSGDGGDEYLGGYDHVRWAARVRRTHERVPKSLRRLSSAVLARLGSSVPRRFTEHVRRAQKGLATSLREPQDQLRSIMALWRDDEVDALLLRDGAQSLRPWTVDFDALATLTPEEHAMAVLSQSVLPSAFLAKVDRMSMAASLEVRVPLLDRRVVELALTLPLDLKIRSGVGKYALREVGRRMLPPELFNLPKRGFGVSLPHWFNAAFWENVEDMYRPGTPASTLFDPVPLRRLFAEGKAGYGGRDRVSTAAATERIWLLAMLGRWIERFQVSV